MKQSRRFQQVNRIQTVAQGTVDRDKLVSASTLALGAMLLATPVALGCSSDSTSNDQGTLGTEHESIKLVNKADKWPDVTYGQCMRGRKSDYNAKHFCRIVADTTAQAAKTTDSKYNKCARAKKNTWGKFVCAVKHLSDQRLCVSVTDGDRRCAETAFRDKIVQKARKNPGALTSTSARNDLFGFTKEDLLNAKYNPKQSGLWQIQKGKWVRLTGKTKAEPNKYIAIKLELTSDTAQKPPLLQAIVTSGKATAVEPMMAEFGAKGGYSTSLPKSGGRTFLGWIPKGFVRHAQGVVQVQVQVGQTIFTTVSPVRSGKPTSEQITGCQPFTASKIMPAQGNYLGGYVTYKGQRGQYGLTWWKYKPGTNSFPNALNGGFVSPYLNVNISGRRFWSVSGTVNLGKKSEVQPKVPTTGFIDKVKLIEAMEVQEWNQKTAKIDSRGGSYDLLVGGQCLKLAKKFSWNLKAANFRCYPNSGKPQCAHGGICDPDGKKATCQLRDPDIYETDTQIGDKCTNPENGKMCALDGLKVLRGICHEKSMCRKLCSSDDDCAKDFTCKKHPTSWVRTKACVPKG